MSIQLNLRLLTEGVEMRAVVTAVILGLVASPAMATVFDVGYVLSGTAVQLGEEYDASHFQELVTTVPNSVSVSSQTSLTDGEFSVDAFHSVTADWQSADAGTIQLDLGWEVRTAGSGLLSVATTDWNTDNWGYIFVATGNGSFSGTYSYSGTGDWSGIGYGEVPIFFNGFSGGGFPVGSGSFSVPLVNGQEYAFGLWTRGIADGGEGLDTFGNGSLFIDWKITYGDVVPEPASWAMLIAGFGLVGGAARRRRALA